jgi:DUF2946 family protein
MTRAQFDFLTPGRTLRAVRSKSLRIFLAGFMLIWFGVIIPGHTRGQISVPGSNCGCDCCACNSAATHATEAPNSQPNKSSHCAICDFAAHITLPPPMDLTLAPLGLAYRIDRPAPRLAPVVRIQLVRHDRAPPFAA